MNRQGRRAVIYARVSTDNQVTENQLRDLRAVAERHGWQVVAEYVDNGISGAKGRDARPAFDRLLKSAMRREFNMIMSWSVDRLSRSLQHLVEFLNEIHSKGVHLYLHQQVIDTTTPSGKALFQMCGVFAEFERAMIQERVKAGLQRAKTSGRCLGRPRVSADLEQRIRAGLAAGVGKKSLARQLGVGVSVVQRIASQS
jgi:DNA invertase Pin-like site-specific DNA recombinase